MIAIIPCAGRGARRRPDTNYLPKILLEHQGEPLFEHVVRPIDMSERFEKLVFVLSLKHGQQVIDYIRCHPLETPVKFVWQDEPLGFGHAVLQAREEVLSPLKWGPPVLIHTDDAINSHLREGASLVKQITDKETSTLGVQWRGNVRDYGMVIKDNDHRVVRLIEKPQWDQGGLAMTGIYFIRESRRLFRCLKKLVKAGRKLNSEYQLTHALQQMIDRGTPFKTCYHQWVDCEEGYL